MDELLEAFEAELVELMDAYPEIPTLHLIDSLHLAVAHLVTEAEEV